MAPKPTSHRRSSATALKSGHVQLCRPDGSNCHCQLQCWSKRVRGNAEQGRGGCQDISKRGCSNFLNLNRPEHRCHHCSGVGRPQTNNPDNCRSVCLTRIIMSLHLAKCFQQIYLKLKQHFLLACFCVLSQDPSYSYLSDYE